MIGDDKEVDIGGAQNLHLQAYLFKTGKYGKQTQSKINRAWLYFAKT